MRTIFVLIGLFSLTACGSSNQPPLPAADACNPVKQATREQYGIPVDGSGQPCNDCIAADHWAFGYYPIPGTPVILTADFSLTAAGQCQVATTFSH